MGGEAASPTNPEKGRTGKRKKNNADHPSDALTGDNKYTNAWPLMNLKTFPAKLCDKNRHFWGSYHIYIYFFLNPLRIFIPCVEILFFINRYFIVFIFKYRISLRKFN